VDTYRIALPLWALSHRAILRGKHGGDESEIRTAMNWLGKRLLEPNVPVVEDQLITRVCQDGRRHSTILRHLSTALAIRAILAAEHSLDGSLLQSQIGPYGTERRPFTSRAFQAPIEIGLVTLNRLGLTSAVAEPLLNSGDAVLLANVIRTVDYVDQHKKTALTAGQRWSEFCRRRQMRSDRPLPLWTPRVGGRVFVGEFTPRLGLIHSTFGARLVLTGLVGVTVALGETVSRMSSRNIVWSARLTLIIGLATAVIPVAAVFQFASRPARFGTSISWAIGAYIATAVSLIAVLDFLFGSVSSIAK